MARSTIENSEVQTYKRPARVLHWVTVALIAVQLPIGAYMTYRGATLRSMQLVQRLMALRKGR